MTKLNLLKSLHAHLYACVFASNAMTSVVSAGFRLRIVDFGFILHK